MQTPTFAITPTQEQLDQIERELRFHPSPITRPQALSPSQVEQFNRDGYVLGVPVFDTGEMAVHRRYFDELLARTLAAGKDSYSISTAHMHHRRVWDILTHPRIVACVRDLLGNDVVGWGSHYFCKMPHDGKSVASAPRRKLLAADAVEDGDRVAGDRRRRPRKRVHAVPTRVASSRPFALSRKHGR